MLKGKNEETWGWDGERGLKRDALENKASQEVCGCGCGLGCVNSEGNWMSELSASDEKWMKGWKEWKRKVSWKGVWGWGRQVAKQIKGGGDKKEWLKGWGNERVKSDGKASLFIQAESWIPLSKPLAPDQPYLCSVFIRQTGSFTWLLLLLYSQCLNYSQVAWNE